jgi:hypothetical protein
MPAKAKSKAQARFLGAVAGGRVKVKGLTSKTAREMLKGTKVKKLPARKRKRRVKRKR